MSEPVEPVEPAGPRWGRVHLVGVGIVSVTCLILSGMGRTWWCAQGDWSPWSWEIWSAHNSQHLLDPYTATHVLHGVVFFGALRLLLGTRLPEVRAIVAVLIEAAWEIVENTDRVIQHYRETTISLDYDGDAVLNSAADIAAMGLGYWIASRLPGWASVVGFLATELVLALWIRDSLLLNVLMLLWPIEAVKTWQLGG